MARDLTLSRDGAELLVDVLEAHANKNNNGMAYEIARQIRELFGMSTLAEQLACETTLKLEDTVNQLVKQEKLARRDKLIAEYGFEWRKHEVPFTLEEMQSFESKAKDLIIKEMH